MSAQSQHCCYPTKRYFDLGTERPKSMDGGPILEMLMITEPRTVFHFGNYNWFIIWQIER
jgi:hypothetical protein